MLGFFDLMNLFSNDLSRDGMDWKHNKAAVFRHSHGFCYFHAIRKLPRIDAQKLIGVKDNYELLKNNTKNFCENKPAANALLWGARGCGKSSIVKAVCYEYANEYPSLRVLEIESKDIAILPLLFDCMCDLGHYRFIVFCDDLTFNANASTYYGLKSTLDGSMEQQADNILIYATSNLRHLMPEKADLNMLHTQDSIHETLALSDRFPLQIGFYDNGQKEYLEILENLIKQENIAVSQETLSYVMQEIRQDSLNFATKIGNRNPRTAKSYYALNHDRISKLIKTRNTK
ncbi:ATP-binding protein [Helicobacter trogontum]|uniref:ATP-binding protein n=1 Tax=Helicobacter trogontum TaxID=50960 RepID=A0ABQ0D1Z1_9HELI